MKTTLSRRLGLAVLGIATAATVTVTAATAANAATAYANVGTDSKVASFDIVTSPEETQDLVNGGHGAFSPGDWICSYHPQVTAKNAGFVLDSVRCGDALADCAKALADGQHPDQVAAVEWTPDPRSMAYGTYTCLTELSGPSAIARLIWEAQHPANGG